MADVCTHSDTYFFQIQCMGIANELFDGPRHALGLYLRGDR